jgi:hypothetical protein
MKISLVCIAKKEDEYIQEWISYHLKLGFDKIFIYKNDWDYEIHNPKVQTFKVNGPRMQVPVYNQFIKEYKNEYDWVAILDVDEFLVLKKHNNIHEFIKDYENYDAIGINWVLFGDNNLTSTSERDVLSRFTKRQNEVNPHIKSIVKLNKVNTMHVHNHTGSWVDTNYKVHNNTPFNFNGPIDIAQINHYFCKTKDEFINKRERGRADDGTIRDMKDFYDHNFNEIEDLTAFNFYFNDNNNLFNT